MAPLYEYQCKVCEKDFEIMRSSDERDAPIPCGHCGELTASRNFPLPSQHVWRGSSDGAMPKGKR